MARWSIEARCLSLANLCYARVWSELLTYTPSDAFLMKAAPTPAHYVAAVLNTTLLAAIFRLAVYLSRRDASGRALRCGQWLLPLPLLGVLHAIGSVVSGHWDLAFRYVRTPVVGMVGRQGLLWVGWALILPAALLTLVWGHRVVRCLSVVLLILSPLVPATFVQAAWKCLRYDPTPFADSPAASPSAHVSKPAARVVWIVFDEWDQRLTFDERPAGVKLPELDRFRSEAFYATNAYPPSDRTLLSIPSLTTGKVVIDAKPESSRDALLRFSGETHARSWSGQPNIFSLGRQLGLDTTIVGWYLPYCRALSADLTACYWWGMSTQYNSLGTGFLAILTNQARSLWETVQFSVLGQSRAVEHHVETYRAMLARACDVVADARPGLAFIHFPVPHSPHFYDRATQDFTLGNSPIRGYPGSLEVVDLTLARLREAMERAGTWETTTVLLTSDHWYRNSLALDGKLDRRVPFLMKPAGTREGLTYGRPFNTVVAHDLLAVVLRDQVSDARDVARFLASHAQPPLKQYGPSAEGIRQETVQ
jgi:sulfatase-like protein